MRKKRLGLILVLGLVAAVALSFLVYARHESNQKQMELQKEGAEFVENCFEKLGFLSYEESDPFALVRQYGASGTGAAPKIYLDRFLEDIRKNQWKGVGNHVKVTFDYESQSHDILNYHCETEFLFRDPSGQQLTHTELLGASIRRGDQNHFVLVAIMNDPVGSRLP